MLWWGVWCRMGWTTLFASTCCALILAVGATLLGGWAEKRLGDQAEYRLQALIPHAVSLLLFLVSALLGLATVVVMLIEAG